MHNTRNTSRRARFRLPSPALVISSIALLMSLGGAAYAVGYEPAVHTGLLLASQAHVQVLHATSLTTNDLYARELPTARWIHQIVPLPKDGVGTAVLQCPAHESVISGGYNQGSLNPVVVVDQPISSTAWEVKILSSPGIGTKDATMEGWALCARSLAPVSLGS